MKKEILRIGAFLALVAAIAALALSLTYVATRERIAHQEELELKASLQKVMPEAEEFKERQPGRYTGYKGSSQVGECLKVSSKGYSGDIVMLVGITPQDKVSGVEILKIAETPGLGLNAQDPKFLDQYEGKSLSDKFKAGEDIDALTGATITTNAVSAGVMKALQELKGRKAPRK